MNVYVEVPSQHFVVASGLASLIMSTVRFFIVSPNETLTSCI